MQSISALIVAITGLVGAITAAIVAIRAHSKSNLATSIATEASKKAELAMNGGDNAKPSDMGTPGDVGGDTHGSILPNKGSP